MKVVLFCGGQGMRIREYSDQVPKPMVPIGYRPILWHVMKYYAHYGHKDFVLCLGYKADVIKSYFRSYDETVSNDFVLSRGGREVELLKSDIDDWRITFVDTGIASNIGERLMAVRKHLSGEEYFLANYADGLTDCPLDQMVDFVKARGAVAGCLATKPSTSFHALQLGPDQRITSIEDLRDSGVRLNGGYFVLRHDVFDAMRPGEELVYEPFRRLIERGELVGYPYDGFWVTMDTFKDKQRLDELYAAGAAPWQVWESSKGA
jgi:glucose-1-phosphate cytidylyltransferase